MKSAEIAKLAGVSRSTVSRVMNGYTNVPEETFQKVMRVVQEHNYAPNHFARTLAGKPSAIVGMFFVDDSGQNENIIQSSPFYTEFLAHFTDKLASFGYVLLVSILRSEQGIEDLKSFFGQKMISCGVFMGDIVADEVIAYLSENQHFSILINQREDINFEHIMLLNTANYLGAYKAVECLIQNGHRKIAHIAGSSEKISTKRRQEGYRDCLEKYGIPYDERLIVQAHIHREETGYFATKELITRLKDDLPTAIFAANDLMAIGALQALNEQNIAVPDDISLIGYDNVSMSKYTTPTLATVSTPLEKLAQHAAQTLANVLEGKPQTEPVFCLPDFDVIQRGSIKALS